MGSYKKINKAKLSVISQPRAEPVGETDYTKLLA